MIELGYVQPYNQSIHGKTKNEELRQSFLTLYSIDNDEFYDYEEFNDFNDFIVDKCQETYNTMNEVNKYQHKNIKNYWEVYKKYSTQLQLVDSTTLPSGENVSVIKTFWLKVFQRKWKKIVAERKRIVELRKRMSSLKYRQLHGRWPEDCRNMP